MRSCLRCTYYLGGLVAKIVQMSNDIRFCEEDERTK